MEVKVDIDDNELREVVTSMIAKQLTASWSTERQVLKRTVSDAVKEVVYSEKEFIINMVVERATREIVKKGLPKLLENLGKEVDDE